MCSIQLNLLRFHHRRRYSTSYLICLVWESFNLQLMQTMLRLQPLDFRLQTQHNTCLLFQPYQPKHRPKRPILHWLSYMKTEGFKECDTSLPSELTTLVNKVDRTQ